MNHQTKYETERKMMNALAKKDFERERALDAIYRQQLERITGRIDSMYMRYGSTLGLSPEEMKKVADKMDVRDFQEMAKKAVQEKDFSEETNRWLKVYNLKMRVSREELLKAQIEHELITLYHSEEKYIYEQVYYEALKELKRQSGIHGNSVGGREKTAKKIADSDFYGNNFSERIWGRTGRYAKTRQEVFTSLVNMYTDMEGYHAERKRLMQVMGVSKGEAMRLLRTEMSRANSQAQQIVLEDNDFTHYRYVAEPGACPICLALEGTVHKVNEAVIGVNCHPMHPNCRCSRYGIIEMHHKEKGSNLKDFDVYDSAEDWMNRPKHDE